jgi:hypothetical protein
MAGWVSHALAETLETTDATRRSCMGVIKALFDKQIAEFTLPGSATYLVSNADPIDYRLAALEAVLRHAVERMYVIYVDILSDVDLAQVFLWMQEKSLFGMGALLYNAAPGITFHAADLARNLFLAPFMDQNLRSAGAALPGSVAGALRKVGPDASARTHG